MGLEDYRIESGEGVRATVPRRAPAGPSRRRSCDVKRRREHLFVHIAGRPVALQTPDPRQSRASLISPAHIIETNEQATHRRVDGYRRPWTLAISEKQPVRYRLLG
ncbi:hypothetical protein EVAR_85430_1 [Eumeta japonica]|uniref:Uncharacterized protein n=1 Tax=Eumeta variegata TaxID=151549 RepID=A0A4C1WLN7_EUMVA|nr:hypothetical protein EVAR_85430_1 [Eumeta japonica]